jgi:2-amino-4-hydroxy-6-hydroxymethyldihydropteridine diphosphokinase/dihydropteroate synthase
MIILGLGSNKGDRAALLEKAVEMLAPTVRNLRRSSLYETKALLPAGAPAAWNMPFLNMAITGETALSPSDMLAAIKTIEKQLGRRPSEVWAPREIDLDILAIDNLILEEAGLSIPHRALLDRDFALLPLAQLVPDWCYPGVGKYQGWKAADIVVHKGYSSGSLHEKGIAVYG